MAKTRAELLRSAKRRYTEVDGVRLQSLTELELSTLRGLWASRYNKESDQFDYSLSRRELLVNVLVDDQGEKLFTSSPDDLEAIGQMDSLTTETLYNAARVHCGLDAADEVSSSEKKSA